MASVFQLLKREIENVGDNQNALVSVPVKYIDMALNRIASLERDRQHLIDHGCLPPLEHSPGSLSQRLKNARLNSGLSMAELGRITGISKGYLSSLESDETINPSIDVIIKLAKALDESIDDLVGI